MLYTAFTFPQAPANPPPSANSDDLTVLDGLLNDWNNYAQALTTAIGAMKTDPVYLQYSANVAASAPFGTKGAYHYYIAPDGVNNSGGYTMSGNADWIYGSTLVNSQANAINNAAAQLAAAQANITTLQGMISAYSNTGAGKISIDTANVNAQNALAAQQAQTAQTTMSAETKQIVVYAVVAVVVLAVITFIYVRYFRKKPAEKAAA